MAVVASIDMRPDVTIPRHLFDELVESFGGLTLVSPGAHLNGPTLSDLRDLVDRLEECGL
jgi:hypothetical protein